MHWERLPCNAACVDKISTSRIYEPAVCERCLERFKCSAVVITAARVEAEKKALSGRSTAGSCRERHRSFSTYTLVGAAEYLTVEPRRCWEICFPFARGACPTRRSGAIRWQSGARLDQRVTEPDEYTGPGQGVKPF